MLKPTFARINPLYYTNVDFTVLQRVELNGVNQLGYKRSDTCHSLDVACAEYANRGYRYFQVIDKLLECGGHG